MNKITILVIAGLITISVSGCKGFRQYFNPPPKKPDPRAEILKAEREANLTPHQKRQRQLKQNVFSIKPDKKATRTSLGSSLNGTEQRYLNEYYKENDLKNQDRGTFKLFKFKRDDR
jgi:hypothetical protein